MTFPPNYHDPFAAGIPPDDTAIQEYCGEPILQPILCDGDIVAISTPPILCDGGHYVGIATPLGCGPEDFAANLAAMVAVYRSFTEARAVPRLDAIPAKSRRQRNPRRPSIKTMIEQAEKAAKPLASITLADGTKLDFGQPEPVKPDNSWPLDEFRTKEIKQ
jgi:hypothetical protein